MAVSILLHTSPVLAADAPCGATATEAIAAAEKSLAAKGDKAQAHALACLLAAVKELNSHRSDVVRSDGTPMIKIPNVKHLAKPK